MIFVGIGRRSRAGVHYGQTVRGGGLGTRGEDIL